MVKQRMSTSDVAAEVASLRQRGIVGMRVTNIYDISPKVYVLKLARSGEDGDKMLLLVESGSRFHTVETMPPKTDIPSNFTLKLRKHIRTRRVEAISQLGVDRVVQLTFGTGDTTFHLILEFYAQGNVILTDKGYNVLTLLRSHRDDAKGVATMARHVYPIHTVRLRQPTASEALDAALAAGETLKAAVGEALPYGPGVAAHCAMLAGLEPARTLKDAPLSKEEAAALLSAIRGFERWLDGCEREGTPAPGGAILVKPRPGAAPGDSLDDAVYEEFEPLLEGGKPLEQHASAPMLTFPTFDAAVSAFFAKVHGQRAESQQAQREKAAVGKLEAIRRDHAARLEALARDTEAAERRAALIELNLDAVDAALNAVREALAGGMDWRDLGRMIKEERAAGNPVAGLIDSLQLEKNRITVLLRDPYEDSGSESESDEEEEQGGDGSSGKKGGKKAGQFGRQRAEKVEVDLDLSAHANARAHFEARKRHEDKARRTLEASAAALAQAEAKAAEALAKVRAAGPGGKGASTAAAAAAAARKPYWFERFHWFISSENYLVVSGRDAQQNELLVKRYMRRGDVYVHADLHGASSTIIKNPNPDAPIPPLTLAQAGQACVCRSAAWDAKVVTSAYWVHPEQVSKTAPSGEYLTTGSFMIRGRKNYLPPQPLVMGLAWLFKLGEESVPGHLGERAPRLDMLDAGGSGTRAAFSGALDDDDAAAAQQQEEKQPKSALDAFLDASVDTLVAGSGGGAAAAAFDRYGLGDALHGAASSSFSEELGKGEGESGAAGGSSGGQPRRHLSAKERQLLKKGGAPGGGGAQQQQQQPKKGQQEGKPAAAAAAQQQQVAAAAARGAKAKAARKKSKYAEQDDEERELAMALLQSGGQKKDRKQRKEERKAKMAARKAARSGVAQVEVTEEDIARLTQRLELEEGEEGDSGDEGSGSEEGVAAAAAAAGAEASAETAAAAEEEDDAEEGGEEAAEEEKEDEDEGGVADAAAAAAEKERQEIAELLAEEGVAVLDEAASAALTQLDELTGVPRPGDVILAAVPVCAPYQVVERYKYRVKLVPGTLKKGKAFKQGVELVAGRGAAGGGKGSGAGGAEEEAAARERELIRVVPEMDGINAMVGGVKLQVAGLQKMQQAAKKKKQAAAGKKK